ncbi:hypothetical protein BpHYR1_044735 [Brachionus plicatilis]|uniref:Uncharacterized protein n=1 Tax=Brachionus plicatilis TaxID=10195 RepID=A0A3M7Q751_BRAPC|nr:hypothetical protein BpHYR1_044735 [Brachionus plicatilis]
MRTNDLTSKIAQSLMEKQYYFFLINIRTFHILLYRTKKDSSKIKFSREIMFLCYSYADNIRKYLLEYPGELDASTRLKRKLDFETNLKFLPLSKTYNLGMRDKYNGG